MSAKKSQRVGAHRACLHGTNNAIRGNSRFEEAENVAERALERLERRVAEVGEESVQFCYPGTESVIEDSRLSNLKVAREGKVF